MKRISDVNGFVKNTVSVFQTHSESREFNYSDGADSERELHKILSSASDLSSDSDELQACIVDWPTEYHLSKTRANLLRSLDLSGVSRVLELGCGCGSITRYLAEQEGVVVDSVEGSEVRAGLAALRCRDLENVEISTANFNDISLPEAEYDLVLFVGVTEYAGRFSDAASDQEALNDLLVMGKKACKPDGVLLVAIENRVGMKYALGLSEDHYGVRFVGLDDYPQSTGIRTYTRLEWLSHIARAGFKEQTLLLPFPDYKVPTLVLSDDCDAERAYSSLKGVSSRDYLHPFSTGEDEHRVWQACAQGGTLKDHSNSFLWLLSDSKQALDALAVNPVCEFESPELMYELPNPTPQAPKKADEQDQVEHLNARITELRAHSRSLEEKVSIMSNSIGWRFLNAIRKLLRKNTL